MVRVTKDGTIHVRPAILVQFRWYKILLGLFNALKTLGLRRFANRIGFGLYYLLNYKFRYRIRVVNQNAKLPSPCIMTVNHLSYEDTIIIQSLNELFWHHHLSMLLANFNFKRAYTPYIKWVEAISDEGLGADVVDRMARAIGRGYAIGIWPEGDFTRTGAVMEGFTGAARLYLRVNHGSLESPHLKRTPKVPLLPIFLEGVYESLGPYAIAKRQQLLTQHGTSKTQWKVIVGTPYFLDCPEHITKASLESLTAQIQDEIRKLDPLDRPIVSNPLKVRKQALRNGLV
jgi:1-acyl-sn-glycerol-3-phosphate acyltransferase